MRNVFIVLFVVLSLVVSAVGCTRVAPVEDLDVEKGAAESQNSSTGSATEADVMPVENLPDVKIDPDAEIPSDKDVTDVKVPDVHIDATKGMEDIDETRVDAIDDTIDEP